ncbi:MAG: PilZ domain-containing protein [Planctomycetota bacterium]
MRPEMLNLWLASGLVLFSILLLMSNRRFRSWSFFPWLRGVGKSSGVPIRRVSAEATARDDLLAQGIDGEEADLLLKLLPDAPDSQLARLLNSRFAFEDALEKALARDSELLRELSIRRALDRIRARRGWEVLGEVSQGLTLPVDDEELLIHGPDGISLRTVLIHRDARSLAVRVIESSPALESSSTWEVGVDLQVSFFRADSGCFLFETRLQEQRDLGEWFLFLETPQKIRLEQRRQYVRVPIEGTIRFVHLPLGDRNDNAFDHELFQQARLLDIGTGGMGFVTDAPVASEDLLIIRGIPSLEVCDVTARVTGEVFSEDDSEGGVGVRFVGLSATDRDRIASLVFGKRLETVGLETGFDSAQPALRSDGGQP